MKTIIKSAILAVLTVTLVVNVVGIYNHYKLVNDSAPGKSWSAKTNEEKGAWIKLARGY